MESDAPRIPTEITCFSESPVSKNIKRWWRYDFSSFSAILK